jgi:hypothetical protein
MISPQASLTPAIMLGLALATASCSSGEPQPTTARPNKLFIGCTAPLPAPGGRTITTFLHDEDRAGELSSLFFEVSDPNVAPAIRGNAGTSYRAEPLSQAGADLVRRNVKQAGKPSQYSGMNQDDQMSMNLAVFGGQAIQFDAKAGYGKLAENNSLPTDILLFLEPGWAIGVIVPREKVDLAPAFKASASATLATLLQLQKGCSAPRPSS